MFKYIYNYWKNAPNSKFFMDFLGMLALWIILGIFITILVLTGIGIVPIYIGVPAIVIEIAVACPFMSWLDSKIHFI